MTFLIPIISPILFRCGGWGEGDIFCPAIPIKLPKGWGWFTGRLRNLIGVLPACLYGNWPVAVAYALAVEIPYGDNDKNWLRKLIGRDANWLLYGFVFGGCAIFVKGLVGGIVQGAIGAAAFHGLMKWSNDGFKGHKLSHPYVELGIGFLGMFTYFWR